MSNRQHKEGDSMSNPEWLLVLTATSNKLIENKRATITTDESFSKWKTRIVFDTKENIFKLKGDYLDPACRDLAPIHYRSVRSVVLTAALHLLRLSLLDGGGGYVIPTLLRIDDPVSERFNFF